MVQSYFYRLVLWLLLALPSLASASESEIGFLVVAPDRGFVGNQEIRSIFEDFKKSYPASLALVGREYNGVGTEYSGYLRRALDELRLIGATEIIAIPLFLSASDPVLQTAVAHLPAYTGAHPVRWAPAMADSYLIGQIVLDRLAAVSRDPEQERLLVIGVGVLDQTGEAALKADLEKLLAYITLRKRFKEARAVIYYDRDADGAEEKNKAVDMQIVQAAAKKGRTLPILATLGPKYDRHMGLSVWFRHKFEELDVAYTGEELAPHPNLLLWLKKTANQYVPATGAEIGVIIMAYGMGDPELIQQAVTRLEQRGIRRIVFVRMYALAHHMKDRTDYILGLASAPQNHGHDRTLPAQVRSSALFASFGGYEESPEIVLILHERIMEVSQNPSNETVILVAHGEKTDEGDAQWRSAMSTNIERLKKDPHCAMLKTVHATTVREDWPEKRDKAVAELRMLIQDHAREGRVLVIANRLYGAGPYKKILADLEYSLNDKGLLHPLITRWLEREIGRRTTVLMSAPEGADDVRRKWKDQQISDSPAVVNFSFGGQL